LTVVDVRMRSGEVSKLTTKSRGIIKIRTNVHEYCPFRYYYM